MYPEQFHHIITEIAHTEKDKPDLIDPVKFAEMATGILSIIFHL